MGEIKGHKYNTFGYTLSNENPADIASHGSTVQNLVENDFWWHVPYWLINSEDKWPIQPTSSVVLSEFESELKKNVKTNQSELFFVNIKLEKVIDSVSNTLFGKDPSPFTAVTKLIRVTALALRFIKKIRILTVDSGPLKIAELNEAESLLLRYVHDKHFSDVIHAVSKKRRNTLQRQLGLFIDPSGILR